MIKKYFLLSIDCKNINKTQSVKKTLFLITTPFKSFKRYRKIIRGKMKIAKFKIKIQVIHYEVIRW